MAFVHRLAVHYPDAVMAGILNRQGRTTARGVSATYSETKFLIPVATNCTPMHTSSNPMI